MSKGVEVEQFLRERPVHQRPRRLAEWLNPTDARKLHSLIDKVYQPKNLEIAWERVKANRGAGGVDGQSTAAFGERLDEQLGRLHEELRTNTYQPRPVRQTPIPKEGKPGEYRTLGIPTVYDRVCQQALLNRLEPIFEPVFDDANYGYRRGRSTHDALRKVWKEITSEREWIVDADLKDFFDRVNHDVLLERRSRRIADGRVLGLIRRYLVAGMMAGGVVVERHEGTPQGGPLSPLLANVLLDEDESDADTGRISVLAPVGTAILGYREGTVVEWDVPAGTRRLRIEKILYQSEAAGDFDR